MHLTRSHGERHGGCEVRQMNPSWVKGKPNLILGGKLQSSTATVK